MGKKTNGETKADVFAEIADHVDKLVGKPRPVDVRQLLDNLRSCSLASSITATKNRKKDGDHEKRCYRDVFVLVVGRKPTAAEVLHMVGGVELRDDKT